MTNDQVRGGYYFEPLKDDGPYAKAFEEIGESVGAVLVDTFVNDPTMATEQFSEGLGRLTGHVIGYYVDNASTIVNNANTLLNELNDPNSWSDPLSQGLSDTN